MARRNKSWLFICGTLPLFVALGLAAPAQSAPQYNFNCSSCHGMPPQDNATRNPATGAFIGNHETHQPTSATEADCVKCHVAAGFTTSHLDGRISFPTNLNNSPATAQYKIGGTAITFKNQTSVPALGNCSNANCHFEKTTPAWGSANYSSTADCSACHASPGASAPHAKHDEYYAGVAGCVKCHPDWGTGLKFSHATSAGNRGIKVTMTEGSYSGTGLNFLPSQSASRTLGTCSAIYCHSDGTKNSAYTVATVPSWNAAPGTLGCTGCHGSNGTLVTGSHGGHLSADVASNLNCVECHSATVNGAGAVISVADHADRFVTVKFASSTTAVNGTYNGQAASTVAAQKTPGTAVGSCANVYCHSDGTKAAAPLVGKSPTPAWGGTAMNCTSCHGGGLGSAAFKSISTGRHAKHVLGTYKYNYSCATCHSATAVGSDAIADRNKHVDSKIDVSFSGVAKAGNANALFTATGHAPGQTGTVNDSCSNVYCHSNAQTGGQTGTAFRFRNLTGSKRFNQTVAVSLGCSGCHTTGSTTTGEWTLSGKHLAHVSATVNPAIGKVLACNDCHASGGTNFSRAKHSDGFINYSGIMAGKQSTLDLAGGVCSTAYCHSNGKGAFKSMATNNWFSSATLDCKGCHGSETAPAFASKAGEPNYTTGNSHEKHVSVAADCYTCHRTTTTATGALFATTTHVNKAINVNIPKLAGFNNLSGVYNTTAKTCSATYCHSNGTPVWGNAATGACGTCHDANATLAGAGKPTIATNGHDSHLTLTYGPGAYLGSAATSCQTCHTTYVGGASHVNGTAAYAGGAGSACYNCHAGTVPAWAGAAHSISCETCHDSTPAQLPNGVVAPGNATNFANGHGKHSGSNTCTSCHDQNSAHISGIPGDTKRLLAALGTGNTNCSYCHNDPTKVATAGFRNMSTHFTSKGGGQTMGCSACHDPHGSATNLSMIRAKIKFNNNSANITYTNRSNGWVDLVTFRGLCQVCHTQTAYYRAGVPETSHYTSDCFTCHLHNANGGAFKVSGNCDTCHGYPPVPRSTATAFTFGTEGNYADARFEDYSGGGGAHVVNVHVPKTAKASDGWTPCLTCHNGGDAAHTKVGPISTKISNVSVELKQNYKKYNVGQFISYSGAKLVNPPAVNSSGSCYNSSCHFKPSPRWSTER